MSGRFRAGTAFVLCLAFVLSAVAVFQAPGLTLELTTHSSISIEGDSEFTHANGVVSGSGTPEDPYLISGWEIDSKFGNAIEITDTRSHFVISGVSLFSSDVESYGVGIVLRNVTNGIVNGVSLEDLYWGMQVLDSQNITIRECVVKEISQCALYASSQSFSSRPTMNLTIDNCTIAGCRVVTAEGATIINTGVEVIGTREVLIENNSVVGAMRAVDLSQCTNSTIRFNSFSSNSEYGVCLRECSQTNITHNEMIENGYGLTMSESVDVTVTWNRILGTYHVGIEYSGYSGIHVHHNDFMGNYGSAYAHGDADNTWDDGYPGGGNYWSDYAGIDEYSGPDQDLPGPDGIGDTPYSVTYMSGYYDRYPLMAPVTGPANEAPVAVITVDPPEGTTSTVFTFNASESYDAEDSVDDLMVRWEVGGDGIWETDWATDKTFELSFASIGRNSVHLQVRDTTLLLDDAWISMEIGEAPETAATFVGDEGEDGWFVSVVEVGLEAECSNGIEYTMYRIDGADWAVYSVPISFDQEGEHGLEFYSEDLLGNIEEVQVVNIKIDYTAPTIGMVTENNTLFETSDVNVSWLCSDTCSGIDYVEYSLDGGAFYRSGDTSTAVLSGLNDGTHQLTIRAFDIAGNSVVTEVTIEVRLSGTDTSSDGDFDWLMVAAVGIVCGAVFVAAVFALRMRRQKAPP